MRLVGRRRPGHDDGTETTELVCVVSTVKDTVANLDRFVERNLAAGADHVFLFVDDADRDVVHHLSENAHVTAVPTGAAYWQGRRPGRLNRRQVVNANLANVLLAPFPEVAWLFHIDGDECLDLDRDHLLGLGRDVRTVRLRTLEAVATPTGDDPVDAYKRPLEAGELALLEALDVVRRAKMKEYFRGHVAGKSGLRPSLDLRMRVHPVTSLDGTDLEPHVDDALNVLHDESPTVDEFVRKWSAHLAPDANARFRGRRDRLRSALATAASLELGEDERRELMVDLYDRHVADDVAQLVRLGFLVRPNPEWHRHRPGVFPDGAHEDLDELLDLLRAADKRFFAQPTYRPRDLVTSLGEVVRSESLRHRLTVVGQVAG